MNSYQELKQRMSANPEVQSGYDALEAERAIMQAMINARTASGLTQQQLAQKTGIAQENICKMERGNANPSVRTLQRLAAGMGMKLKLEFVKTET